ncbi:hypothetical protein MRX96_014640 [Rhipicephalus microplus]
MFSAAALFYKNGSVSQTVSQCFLNGRANGELYCPVINYFSPFVFLFRNCSVFFTLALRRAPTVPSLPGAGRAVPGSSPSSLRRDAGLLIFQMDPSVPLPNFPYRARVKADTALLRVSKRPYHAFQAAVPLKITAFISAAAPLSLN